ncbi:Pheromone-binding protein 1 [Operophtera brumata]|uniref:Pheromone-binding protein 1 n=1 Tax=Operophtera brumata TaxID=104452 RepID=A0A0L7KX95_OPEBR|nr:Pheromone-binding protein 1 [Operophtera brumata]
MARLTWCLVLVCLWGLERSWGSQEVLLNMSKGFGAAFEDCKIEDHIMQDFFNFWREDYALVNRELGCMVICVAQRLGLMDADMKMHHGNAHEFAQKHGAVRANRELGCMVICVAQRLGLMDADMMMHHGNAHEFAQKHGADDETAKKLVSVCHDCEKQHEAVEDHCARILEVAKCFRTKIHELKWAPSMAVVMEEMMNAL